MCGYLLVANSQAITNKISYHTRQVSRVIAGLELLANLRLEESPGSIGQSAR